MAARWASSPSPDAPCLCVLTLTYATAACIGVVSATIRPTTKVFGSVTVVGDFNVSPLAQWRHSYINPAVVNRGTG